jgi:hypothetical protein
LPPLSPIVCLLSCRLLEEIASRQKIF